MKILNTAFLYALPVLLFSSCTGEGTGGNPASDLLSLSPLLVPEKVSVVDPQTTGSAKPLAASEKILTDFSATSDYRTDKVSVYVNERSLESFKTVNEILCMLRQTRYDAMLNKGPYRAQVDTNLCRSDRDSASSGGEQSTNQSSGSTMPAYETWIVKSYRFSSDSPHFVDAWIHSANKPQDPPMVINVKVVISEGADMAPPYGIFKANFKALDKETLTNVLFKGFLNAERDPGSGKILLKFSTEDKDSYQIEKATLDKSVDGTTGAGSVFKAESYPNSTPKATRFNIAYNATNFRRLDNDGIEICLDRASPPDESAWRYGLYNMDGSRVLRNSGFPIKIGTAYGWVGYWGAWLPTGVTVKDGDPVMKHDYATNTDTPYTIIRADGKLKKHTKKTVTLGNIKNIPLMWWDGSGKTYQVVWTGTVMNTVAEMVSTGNSQAWQNYTTPVPFDLTALSWYELGFWSPSLSGQVIIKFPPPDANLSSTPTSTHCGYVNSKYNCSAPAANDSVPVVYYSENIVYPTDTVPATLACFDNCPNVVSLATSTPYRTDIVSYQSGTAPINAKYASYSFNKTSMLLYDSLATKVTLTIENTSYTGGISSGPLFDPAYLTDLACDWDPSSTCGGKAWSVLTEFYTWETGSNEWNKFTGLKDISNNVVKFDPPLQVEYTHVQTDNLMPDSKYNNTKFYLQYAGFGDLQGIPGKCVNVDTGADADCSTSGSNMAIRWVPEFTIPDLQPGTTSLTEVKDVTTAGVTYIVKALEKEQRMKKDVTVGACNNLDAAPYTLPSMSSYIDPVIGLEPVVTSAPAVIGGVVQ